MAGEQLRVIEGRDAGKRLSVEADLLVGRETPDDEGSLGGDPEISRRHALVSRAADGQLTIEDLGSANGTFVNDERIDAPRVLHLGDVVRMGKTVLRVADRPGAAPTVVTEPEGAAAAAPAGIPAEVGEVFVVTAGPAQGSRLTPGDSLLLGREVSGAGSLSDDVQLSRRHARIARDERGELGIEDLGSANGTFVNGERVHGRRTLRVGDSVRVGLTTLKLSDERRAPGPAAVDAGPLRAAPPAPGKPHPAAMAAVDEGALGEPVPELRPGSVFAGCRVEEVIGRGDMGVVYRAEELALQRWVALKLILPEHSRDQHFRERFRRESKIAAAIDHPNVIPIFDAGDENGVLFIVMRLVEGTDLRSVIAAEGPLEPLRSARIVRQVGGALDAAHARGMLHRDVKPSNVLLTGADHVYLSDFGLAKQAAADGQLTRQGSIVARAEYVAPEQVLNQRVGPGADIYALGCLLFEVLTGEPPYARWEAGPAALAHVDAPPPSPLAVRPELPGRFDEVVRRAMAKDPAERYRSAGELGRAALDAAGQARRERPRPVPATAEAAAPGAAHAAGTHDSGARAPVSDGARAQQPDSIRWAIAIAGLLIVAAGMVAALHGISSL
jgi:pSer/pThr/pTyr-binding forkhead associated (FHA) protein